MALNVRFFPRGARAIFERFDQGEDIRTTPGGRVVAPWAGTVRLAPSNPGGFGTHYGLFTPSEGPYQGRTFYIGHAWAFPGRKRAGQTIAITGRGTESWMGNARGIPGHVEIGFWPPGSMSSGHNVARAVAGEGPDVVGTAAGVDAATSWKPCTLTWYDPALGGINTTGGANPHARTASGQPYDPNAYTCAAPPQYKFGTIITFKFRNQTIACRVNDRGGAIIGSHFDLSRAAATRLGIIGAGKVRAQFSMGNAPATASGGRTRPGGGEESDTALATAFASYYEDNSAGTGPAIEQTISTGPQGQTQPVGFFGLPFLPLPFPKLDIPNIPDPLKIFKQAEGAVNSTTDFLKWITWLFHPVHILRVVEFITGITLMGAGLHTAIAAHRAGGGGRGRGRARRRGQSGVITRERVVKLAKMAAK